MTQTEWRQLYLHASQTLPGISLRAVNKMHGIYIKAAEQVALKLKAISGLGYSPITTDNLTAIQSQLEQAAYMIEQGLNKAVPTAVKLGQQSFDNINYEYLIDISKYSNGKITQAGIQTMLTTINNSVNMSIFSRIYQDGYSFSERVWRAGKDFQNQIKDVISAGLAQGRDILDIARDLNVYVKTDKLTLIKRYGDLLSGTKEFAKRIRKNVYFPSLRLIRSELYASSMDASKLTGQYNPGCSGLWDWVRTGLTDWNCNCPENAQNSPYPLEKIPAYDHLNCLCKLVPRLRNQIDFVNDIKAWGNGANIDYLEKWYNFRYPNIASRYNKRNAA